MRRSTLVGAVLIPLITIGLAASTAVDTLDPTYVVRTRLVVASLCWAVAGAAFMVALGAVVTNLVRPVRSPRRLGPDLRVWSLLVNGGGAANLVVLTLNHCVTSPDDAEPTFLVCLLAFGAGMGLTGFLVELARNHLRDRTPTVETAGIPWQHQESRPGR